MPGLLGGAAAAGAEGGAIGAAGAAAAGSNMASTLTFSTVGAASLNEAGSALQGIARLVKDVFSNPATAFYAGGQISKELKSMSQSLGLFAAGNNMGGLFNLALTLSGIPGIAVRSGAALVAFGASAFQAFERSRELTSANLFQSKQTFLGTQFEGEADRIGRKYGKDMEQSFKDMFFTIRMYEKDWSQDTVSTFTETAAKVGKITGIDMRNYLTQSIQQIGRPVSESLEDLEIMGGIARDNNLIMGDVVDGMFQVMSSTRLMDGDFDTAAKTLLYFKDALQLTRDGMAMTKQEVMGLTSSITSFFTAGTSGLKGRAIAGTMLTQNWGKLSPELQNDLDKFVSEQSQRFPELKGKKFRQLSTQQQADLTRWLPANLQMASARELANLPQFQGLKGYRIWEAMQYPLDWYDTFQMAQRRGGQFGLGAQISGPMSFGGYEPFLQRNIVSQGFSGAMAIPGRLARGTAAMWNPSVLRNEAAVGNVPGGGNNIVKHVFTVLPPWDNVFGIVSEGQNGNSIYPEK
jgi:hypothetical protein